MPRSNVLSTSVAAAAFAFSGLLTAGCASNNIQAQWTDPQFAGQSLRGEKILVVCDGNDTAIKRICQDRLGEQIAAAGATPVTVPESDNLTAGSGQISERTLAAARSMAAKAIFSSTIAPDATVARPRPSFGIGVGGFGGSGGWNRSGVGAGVGISVPVGGGQIDTAYGANMVLTDASTGRIMWTSKVTAPASRDVNAQIGTLAKAAVEAAQKAGFL